MESIAIDRPFDRLAPDPTIRMPSPEQAAALRAFLEGRETPEGIAAVLFRLASKSKTRKGVCRFIQCCFQSIRKVACVSVDVQPRLVELIRALAALPTIPDPQPQYPQELKDDTLAWGGPSGLKGLRTEAKDALLGK